MKITVIYGTQHHGSTWNVVDALLTAVGKRTPTEVTSFMLPQAMPHFCVGCYSCFMNGENTCPHAQQVQPIAQALIQSDVMILASPVYALDVNGQMKALLDHLCYLWMSHRPDPAMFAKIGIAVATTAGAGLGHTVKTMKNSLRFWGAHKVIRFPVAVSAMNWSQVSEKKRRSIAQKTEKLSMQLIRLTQNQARKRAPLLQRLLFHVMASMQRNNDWNPRDRAHWEAQGWLDGRKPYARNNRELIG